MSARFGGNLCFCRDVVESTRAAFFAVELLCCLALARKALASAKQNRRLGVLPGGAKWYEQMRACFDRLCSAAFAGKSGLF